MKGKGRKSKGQEKRGGDKGGRKGGKRGSYRGVKNNRRPSGEPIKKKKDAQSGGKKTFCFNRYRDKQRVEEELKKKKILEDKIEKEYDYSESDEEVKDPLQQLMSTFKNTQKSLKSRAVESSDEESESEEEEMDAVDQTQDSEAEEMDVADQTQDSEAGDDVSDEEATDISDIEVKEDDEIDENSDVSLELKYSNDEEEESENEIPAGQVFPEEIEKSKLTLETDKDDADLSNNDPFVKHLKDDLHDSLLQSISQKPQNYETTQLAWPCLGRLVVQIPKMNKQDEIKESAGTVSVLEKETYAEPGKIPTRLLEIDWEKLCIKKQIQEHIVAANKTNMFRRECELEDKMTPLQKELFSIINNYQDLYYAERSFLNAEEIRATYCLHALNHLVKTRTKILHHNAKLSKKSDVPDEFRDQGLVRPKVIVVVPFKDSAYKIVKMLIEMLVPGDASQVVNKNRFEEDFTGNEIQMPKKNPKPEDYELTFSGNTDDTFRIGLSITKKTLKLYSDFYSSDLIVASPLGLRVIVGAEGEEERDFDFLASVELLIMDQTEIFLMQNWDHLLHVLDHFHLQPKKTHGTDFSRLRSWAVNGWTKYYRQTLVFSSIALPEINSLFNKKCFNYAGKVRVHNPIDAGTIRQVAVQVPQVFRRIEAKDPLSSIETRFEYFIKEVLPQYKDGIMAHTLIYVPSYFDYVRIRNYFKKEDMSFVQICEYSKDAKIARARDMFFHSEGHFLLYSERFHFFRRMRIKGIRHIIFYQPPIFPHFYSELCNLMQEGNQNKYGGSESNMTVTVLYTKYDLQPLSAIVSSERTSKMCQSDKNVHMFMTGD